MLPDKFTGDTPIVGAPVVILDASALMEMPDAIERMILTDKQSRFVVFRSDVVSMEEKANSPRHLKGPKARRALELIDRHLGRGKLGVNETYADDEAHADRHARNWAMLMADHYKIQFCSFDRDFSLDVLKENLTESDRKTNRLAAFYLDQSGSTVMWRYRECECCGKGFAAKPGERYRPKCNAVRRIENDRQSKVDVKAPEVIAAKAAPVSKEPAGAKITGSVRTQFHFADDGTIAGIKSQTTRKTETFATSSGTQKTITVTPGEVLNFAIGTVKVAFHVARFISMLR